MWREYPREYDPKPLMDALPPDEEWEFNCAHVARTVRQIGAARQPEVFPEQECFKLVNILGITTVMCTRMVIHMIPAGHIIEVHKDGQSPEGTMRYHFPLQTHPDCKVFWPEHKQGVHMEIGIVYQFRYQELHCVTNYTDVDRYHFIADFEKAKT